MNNIVKGITEGVVTHNYSDCSGYVSGYVSGDIGTKKYYGILNGTLTNYAFNQIIPIFGTVTGTLNEDTHGSPESGYTISIKDAFGIFTNIEPLLTADDHVLDIKHVNTLGRKALSKANSILGTNLNKTTKNIDEYEQYGLEKWQLIEYVSLSDKYINENTPSEIPSEIPYFENTTRLMNTRTRLATPQYINELNNLVPINGSDHQQNEDIIQEQIYKYTANFISNDIIKINKYLENEAINSDSLIVGPLLDKNILIEKLEYFMRINNYELIQISEDEFKIEIPLENEVIH